VTEGTNVTASKTIHSRSNKNIGDVIEGQWEITAKKVIAEPRSGDGQEPPRFGIYEYEVKPTIQSLAEKGRSDKSAASKLSRAKQQSESNVGGTRREAASVPLTVRRTS
jgi:hypothetical protein